MSKWKTVGLLILAAVALSATLLIRHLRPMSLSAERRAARAAGLPLAPADFPRPPCPPGQDSEPGWKALAPRLRAARDTGAWRSLDAALVAGFAPETSNRALFRLVAEQAQTLNGIHAATGKPFRSLLTDWRIDSAVGDLDTARTAAKLLRYESLAAARGGHPVEGIRLQAAGLRLAGQISGNPSGVCHVAGAAIEGTSLTGMADIARENPSPAVAAAIRAAIARDAPEYDIVRGLKGDTLIDLGNIRRANSMAAIRALSATSADRLPSDLERRPSGLIRFGFQEPAEAVYLHYMARMVRAAAAPPGERDRAMRAVGEAAQQTATKGPAYGAASAWLPVYPMLYESLNRALARRAVTAAGAGVLAWRTQHGAFPAKLADAAGQTTDPYTGRPLGYRRTKDGFVVYSVGMDGRFMGLPGPAAREQTYFSFPSARLGAAAAAPGPVWP